MKYVGGITVARVTTPLFVLSLVAGSGSSAVAEFPVSEFEADGPVAVVGALPKEGVQLDVSMLPTAEVEAGMEVGDALAEYKVDSSAITVGNGHYQIAVDPLTLPVERIDNTGLVTFHVVATNAAGEYWSTTLSARAVRTATGAEPVWVDPLNSAAMVETSSSSAGDGSRVPRASLPRNFDEAPVEAPALTLLGNTKSGASSRSSAESCPYHTLMRKTWPLATIGTTYPIGGAWATMKVETSVGAKYGAAASIGTSTSAGDWYKDGTRHASGSWGFNWDGTTQQRSYRKGVEYRVYRTGRETASGGCIYEWTYTPSVETGAVDNNTGLTRPDWNTDCATIGSRGEWKRILPDRSPYTFSKAVSVSHVIGFTLGIARQYSEQQFIVYDIQGSRKRKICGNDGFPSVSGKQIARYYPGYY